MKRSSALDGLRGFAAAAVAFYHAILHNDLSQIDRILYQPIQESRNAEHLLSKIVLTVLNGETAVFLFFVLSGAVLGLSLQRRDHGNVLGTAAVFVRNRVLRLYPPLIVCLLLMFALGLAGVPGLPRWDGQALLENSLLLSTPMHGPSDTLRAEMMAVPMILIAWLLRRAFGLPGLLLAFVYAALSVQSMELMFGLPSMHVYAMFFVGGMIAAEPGLRALLEQVPPRGWWLVLLLAVAGRSWQGHGAPTAMITSALCCAFLVAGLLHGRLGYLGDVLEGRVAQAIGKVSFSLYLYNVPVLFILWGAWTDRLTWVKAYPVSAGILIGALSLLITWPLARLSEYWIERRFNSYCHSLASVPAQARLSA